jgi:hypothetical protein
MDTQQEPAKSYSGGGLASLTSKLLVQGCARERQIGWTLNIKNNSNAHYTWHGHTCTTDNGFLSMVLLGTFGFFWFVACS